MKAVFSVETDLMLRGGSTLPAQSTTTGKSCLEKREIRDTLMRRIPGFRHHKCANSDL